MPAIQQDILDMVDRIPAFPVSVQRVLALCANIDCAPKDLVRVINHDPVLTLRILRVANSAYFGLSQPIVSINHAVVYLGLNTVKHVALAIAAIGMLPARNEAGLDTDQFLLHSLTTAVVTRTLARRLRVREVEAANFFVAGLLHDIGLVVFAQFKPQEYRKVLQRAGEAIIPLHEAEAEILGMNHAELGGLLAEKWQLPDSLIAAFRQHHDPQDEAPHPAMRDCLCAADVIAGRMGYPAVSDVPEGSLPDWVFHRFKLNLQGLTDEIGDVIPELEHVRGYVRV